MILAALFSPLLVFCQSTEGVVTFEETVKMTFDLPPGESEALRRQMPNTHTVRWELYFTAEKSLYREPEVDENAEATQEAETEGASVRMVMMRPELRVFKHLDEDRKVEGREFMGRKFLIRAELKALPWKLAGEQKKILDYTCQKAVLQDTSRTVEAWFAPGLPVPNGPMDYGQLPGMILELSMDKGDRVITATKVELKKLPGDAILEPTKGKEVTQEEFDRIREEKMKEMGAERGRGGARIMIRNE